jgi:hypothetical protein
MMHFSFSQNSHFGKKEIYQKGSDKKEVVYGDAKI